MIERIRCSECNLPIEPGEVPSELCECIPFRAKLLLVVLCLYVVLVGAACVESGRLLPDAGVDDRVSSARVALVQWQPTLMRGWDALEQECWRDADAALDELRRLEALINQGVPHVDSKDPLREDLARYAQLDHFRVALARSSGSNRGCR